jgi:catechol 2,3-dioxygenase-like lactoylglutathione lyase family enzyme
MAIEFNHTIVWSHDPKSSAKFLAGILGLPEPKKVYHFEVVTTANGVNVDFAEKEGEIRTQHYAFLVGEPEFDAIFGRIKERGLQYWADPARSKAGEINRDEGGRGVYFQDPSGHLLEIITRPYGGG